ncbi:hydrogenase/sulfur reductase subunit alpha [candidate division WOR-1 bacterium RIFOXYA12_FULL_43_27]|uniref:Hydrogenase/sulfur reductase subunit alpha n=1 Tax=candidate division WOR-1 bacterium RIFOXYC2_FULL_46_14 TaxID=1802587 RepID=A0A1F4U5E3_UNCSA|nr:MAG: hydrogenase/sulfur reductase subunit alpha [candidate division WOR-1 bacterium RIFOXYA12_FULL_43_27]OGC20342.1 MAG: hydrogenase/sulfur reductase subunit alpha [candidate division WOR-1 bacterium RIFOXYB2_FULL_46_45]OGC31921.1 MAG: hydrogenase/sulfur reductase subunit alpha [candidate division WOR-1 bacterium RIFOXYA2_FULL_46_56]OGC40188.1 MAG: hydrogenase/sulfur reductase subunit alpha [candidate division WOR-1 bacterium RIFOXYC2_FULL_46_14]
MSKRNVSVNVEYLTRVEGHGNIVVDVKEGKLETCQLQIVESPRFFEGMIKGRSIFEAQHITCRICGICSCGHTLASIQAAEDAIGFKPSKQTTELRKFLLHMENLDSHILHIYLLVAPDLLGVKSFVPLIDTHNKVVRRALRMKKAANDVCDILVGRHVHPISSIVGGFTKLPKEKDLDAMLQILYDMRADMTATVELAATLKFPQFERDMEFVGLVSDDAEYPMLMGDIGSTDGKRINKKDYKKATNEFVVPHSSAKHAKWNRESYMVGALARVNLNAGKLHPKAKELAAALGVKPKVINPYLNTVAQLIECVHSLEDGIRILEEFKKNGVNQDEVVLVGLNEQDRIKVKPGIGVGAVEVPRGILFHNYEVDEKGIIIKANCIIPTSQNVNNIEHDMRKLVPEILDKTDEEITLALEMLVRAYDPCISCSAHFLDVKFVGR